VVDDSALSRAWVVRVLLDEGYIVGAAADGAKAVEHIRDEEPDVIVLGQDLPGFPGYRLVEMLRTDGVSSGIVMLTDSASEDDERDAIRTGVDDVLRLPCPAGVIANAVVDAWTRGRARRARYQREHHLDGEMRAAAAIQAALLPEPPGMPGWRIEAGFLPASQVGGDCYDLFAGPDRTLVMVLADVSGKGVGAALLAGMAQTALRAAFLRGDGPAEALAATNAVLYEPLGRAGRFLTAFAGRISLADGDLVYADAGHGHSALVTPDGERPLPCGGQPLGLLPDVHYEQGRERLEPGERLAVFSDGLVEGEGDPADWRLQLIEAVRRNGAVDTLVAEAPDADDRTMILVERLP
jgi:sigma-B regulation protein RsbU (phosphoserine phosphatase)